LIIFDFCVYIYLLDLSSIYERKHVAFEEDRLLNKIQLKCPTLEYFAKLYKLWGSGESGESEECGSFSSFAANLPQYAVL
jgi:hypothetical protein